MRTSTLIFAASVSLAAFANAQSLNEYRLWPDTVSGATRVGIPATEAGDVTQRFDQGMVRGVGGYMAGTPGRLNGWRCTIQDTDRTTGELFSLAVIADDPANPGQPDPTNDLIRTGNVSTPSDTMNTGGVAWLMTITLTTPADVLPATGSYHLAIGLSASAEQSMWICTYSGTGNGDNPRAGAPNLTYGINRTTPALIAAPSWTSRIYALTENPTLVGGADIDPAAQRGPNPSFGVAGVFLDRMRGDGIAIRVRDANSPGAIATTFIGFLGFNPSPISLVGIAGEIHLTAPLVPDAFSTTLDANGDATQILLPFGHTVPALGSLQLQTVVSDPVTGAAKLTNAVELNDA